jgi:hypothetical protein
MESLRAGADEGFAAGTGRCVALGTVTPRFAGEVARAAADTEASAVVGSAGIATLAGDDTVEAAASTDEIAA